MLVNLYVDHMMNQSPTSSDDVLAATRDHSRQFTEAAARIGLSPAEYREFRTSLLDGNVMYVKLPRRVDAMSANHRGSIYVVKNAVVPVDVMSWRVKLADGNTVYVPQICGNISLLRPAAVAAVPHHVKPAVVAVHHRHPKFVPALGTVAAAPAAPAAVAAPAAAPAVVPVAAPAADTVAAAPAAAPASRGFSPFLFAIPAVIGGIVAGVSHHDSPTLPPCSAGSNLANACQR